MPIFSIFWIKLEQKYYMISNSQGLQQFNSQEIILFFKLEMIHKDYKKDCEIFHLNCLWKIMERFPDFQFMTLNNKKQKKEHPSEGIKTKLPFLQKLEQFFDHFLHILLNQQTQEIKIKTLQILNKMLLQVISTSPLDSRIIEAAGAHRIQLVSALQIGGLTPPSSIIRRSLECVSIPTNVILRHHNNSFCYTQEQKNLLLQDIDNCKCFKPAGVVIGGLTNEKQIDQNFLSNIIKEVGGKMTITFHKASDQTSSIFERVKILQEKKIDTVLTQGGIKPIEQNLQCLHKLVHDSKMNILLGGGISHNNIEHIIKTVEPKQIHIGTCVRKNKYGPVDGEKVRQFLKLMEQKK